MPPLWRANLPYETACSAFPRSGIYNGENGHEPPLYVCGPVVARVSRDGKLPYGRKTAVNELSLVCRQGNGRALPGLQPASPCSPPLPFPICSYHHLQGSQLLTPPLSLKSICSMTWGQRRARRTGSIVSKGLGAGLCALHCTYS